MYGDVPLVTRDTVQELAAAASNGPAILTAIETDPTGYGRIVRDSSNTVIGIIEQKDANEEQLKIKECNTGILLAKGVDLKRWLANLSNDNAQGEYYLTDIIAACHCEDKIIALIQSRTYDARYHIHESLGLLSFARRRFGLGLLYRISV